MPLIQLKPALERGQYYKGKIYVGGEVLFVEQEELINFAGMTECVEEENMPDSSNDEANPGEPTPPDSGLSDDKQEDLLNSDDEAPNPSEEVTNNLMDEPVDETANKEPVQDNEEVTKEVNTPEAGNSIPEGGANPSGSSKNNRRRGK